MTSFHAEPTCSVCPGTGRIELFSWIVQCDSCISIRERRRRKAAFIAHLRRERLRRLGDEMRRRDEATR